jgi:hypothetical protein
MKGKRPWADWLIGKKPEEVVPPHEDTLRRWRMRADQKAQKLGVAGACHICKRPVKYQRGTIKLWPAKAWRAPATTLRLCSKCQGRLRHFLAKLQTILQHDEMPIDE